MFIEPAGVSAILIHFDAIPDKQQSLYLAKLSQALQAHFCDEIADITNAWDTMLIQYNLLSVSYQELVGKINYFIERYQPSNIPTEKTQLIEFPVWYNGEDLAEVAELCKLSIEQVIEIHSTTTYYVGAIGFSPGFAYLGGLDARLKLPRKASPRSKVPKGSVSIAELQTAIYPNDSPGGWNLIGMCPIPLFDPHANPPCPFKVGYEVRFYSVSEKQYNQLINGENA